MIKTISEYDFRQAWKDSGRENSFSYEGLGLLFETLEELSPESEIDIIALDCEFAENTLEEIISDYGYALADSEEEEPTLEEVLDYLQNNTLVCGTTPQGTIVYMQF